MTNTLSIAIAQLNITMGDFTTNIKKHIEAASNAKQQGADLIVFPELSLTGYPPEDLLLRPDFQKSVDHALNEIMSQISGIHCLVGHPSTKNNKRYNTSTLFYNNHLVAQYHKRCLPNNGVFDECRYFSAGSQPLVINLKNTRVGFLICEDSWHTYPIQETVAMQANLLIIQNASPYEVSKHEERVALLSKTAEEHQVDIIYTNLVGGQDELVFDGGSMAIKNTGELHCLLPFFEEKLQCLDFKKSGELIPLMPPIERMYQALCLGLRDYINKNQIKGALIGLSGGIDSALTLAIAVDALGPARVHAVMMPSSYTADISKEDAEELARILLVKYDVI